MKKSNHKPDQPQSTLNQDTYRYMPIFWQAVGDPNAFAIELFDDSMAPDFNPGDICVFAPIALINDGDPCFVQLDSSGRDEKTFRRVTTLSDGSLELRPFNSHHKVIRERWVKDGGVVTRVVKCVGRFQRFKQEPHQA